MRSLRACIQHMTRVGGETWCLLAHSTVSLGPVGAQDLIRALCLGERGCTSGKTDLLTDVSSRGNVEALPVDASLQPWRLPEPHSTPGLSRFSHCFPHVNAGFCVIVLKVFSLNLVSLLS